MIFVGLLLTALVGWLLLPRRLETDLAGGLSLGFLLASFAVSLLMFILGVAGLPWNGWLVAASLVCAAGWKVSRERPTVRLGWSPGGAIALAAAAATVAAWLPYERAMPLTSQSWDAWAIWLFKSKAFYLDGGLGEYLSRSAEFKGQPGYPLLTPLYGTWLYELAGGVDDQSAKLISPCYYLALLGSIWWAARRAADAWIAGAATAMAALTPIVAQTAFALAGYADTALAAYFVAAAGLLWGWLEEKDSVWLAAAVCAATAAAWTKNEGQLFLLAFILTAAAALLRNRTTTREWRSQWTILIAPPAVLLGAWTALRAAYGVEASGFALGLDFQPALASRALADVAARALAPSGFALSFPLLVAAVVGLVLLRAPLRYALAPAWVLWQLAGALLAYATGRNEIEWWLQTSADRILSQLAPLAVLGAAMVAGLWLERRSAPTQPTGSAQPTQAPPSKSKRRQRRKAS